MIFDADKHDDFVLAALDFVTRTKSANAPDEKLAQAATSYCPWAGLAEAQDWPPDKIHQLTLDIGNEWKALGGNVKQIEQICIKYDLDPRNHPYSLLKRQPYLIPSLRVLGMTFGPEPKPEDYVSGAPPPPSPKPLLPQIAPASSLSGKEALWPEAEYDPDGVIFPDTNITPVRIDHAIGSWLEPARLADPGNVSDMRLFFAVMGCLLVSDYSQSRREQLTMPRVVHPLALRTAIHIKADRARKENEKSENRKQRHLERQAAKRQQEQ